MSKLFPWNPRWVSSPKLPPGHHTASERRTGLDCLGAAGAIAASLCVALLIGLGGCARNPVTGRPEAVLTSEKGEIEQGKQAARLVQEEIGLVQDPELEAFVNALGQRLAQHSLRAHLEYRFQVADMPEANAFALPGGPVYVSRGLLALVNSEDELAAVLGHEIAHVEARHSVRRQTASAPLVPLRIAAALGGAAASIVSPGLGQVVAGIGQLPGAFAMAAYSRDQEREADKLGQELTAAAGFDPMGLAAFATTLAREEKLEGKTMGGRSFLVSHPSSPERSSASAAYARELTIAPDQPAPLDRYDFLRHLEGLVLGEPAAAGVFVDERFLHPELGIAFLLPSRWKTLNGRRSVSAQSPDAALYLVMEIVGEGEDAMRAARAFGQIANLDSEPRALRIHDLEAAKASTLVRAPGETRQVLLAWIACDGLIYRIAGIAPLDRLAELRPDFKRTADSFHRLSDAERREIFEDRLRLTEVRAGETLEAVNQRSENQWDSARTALANGIQEESKLVPGTWLKIARSEPYRLPARDNP